MSGRAKISAADLQKKKQALISFLAKNPIVQNACQKVGISRMMFYRWKNSDQDFKEKVIKAQKASRNLVNDVVESKLIQKASEGDSRSMEFYLKNNHARYKKGVDEEDKVIINFAVGKSPFIQPEDSKESP